MVANMTDAYIYDAVRTPRGKGNPGGSLHEVPPVRLASQVLERLRDRNQLDTSQVDDIVMGVVEPAGEQGACLPRVAALYAQYDLRAPGVQINRFCASGLEAVNMASAQIMSGQSDLTIGGGVESMSRVKMGTSGGAWMADPDVAFPTYFIPQGISADLIATRQGYSRDDVDAYAVESQRRAAIAHGEGRFGRTLEPVHDVNGATLLDYDEHARPESTMQSLAALEPAFVKMGQTAGFDDVAIMRYPEVERINHVHHAGNSSGIVDGAAAVLLGTKEAGEKHDLKPRARIKGFASIGSEPAIMLTGPSDSAAKVLARIGMNVNDIDLFEVNEAFACVPMLFMDVLNVAHDKVNVNGGAIALGHPLGATGAMLLATLLDELERQDKETGLATLCIGAGMGTATVIERV